MGEIQASSERVSQGGQVFLFGFVLPSGECKNTALSATTSLGSCVCPRTVGIPQGLVQRVSTAIKIIK